MTGCSIAVGLLIDTSNIGWNCLGGGIQYLLPTMIEPKKKPIDVVQQWPDDPTSWVHALFVEHTEQEGGTCVV